MKQFQKLHLPAGLLAAGLCWILALGMVLQVSADPLPQLASEAAILMDAETGQILFEKNGNQKMYPASITKVMTGMLALKNLDPQQILTVSQSAVNAVPITSSHVSLEPGEELTLDQAMHALAMESANDAANVLAEAVSGSLTAFGQKMTEEAQSLGAYNTHFTNANGLPDSEHYTTAYDMALITAAALKVPGFTDYFSTLHYECAPTNLNGKRSFSNKNRMFTGDYWAEGVLMSKTGWTSSAQGTLVSAVRQGDTTLIAVTLKSVMLEDKYRDTRSLLEYGFQNYQRVTFTGEAMVSRLALGDFCPAPGQSFSFLIPVSASVEEVSFSLHPDTQLSAVDSVQAEITVLASLGDTILPASHLILVRQYTPQAVPAASFSAPEENIISEPSADYGVIQVMLIAAGGFLIFLLAAIPAHRKNSRRQLRRRRLDAKIRQMKKKME